MRITGHVSTSQKAGSGATGSFLPAEIHAVDYIADTLGISVTEARQFLREMIDLHTRLRKTGGITDRKVVPALDWIEKASGNGGHRAISVQNPKRELVFHPSDEIELITNTHSGSLDALRRGNATRSRIKQEREKAA